MTLNAKLMNEKLKRGWTPADFAEYLSTTEELFLKSVQETFSRNAAKSMISSLKRNQKRKNSQRNHIEPCFEQNVTVDSDTNDTLNIEVPEQNFEAPCSCSDILEKLTLESEKLSKNLFEKETEHKNLISNRKKQYDSLRCYKERLHNLEQEIQKCKTEILEIAENISSITDEIQEANSEIKTLRKEISEIKKEIEKLSNFSIYVYENGNIEIEGELRFEIPETCNSLVQKLTEHSELECLTIRQIKQLSKLLVLRKALTEQGKTFEFTFESEIIQKYFEQIQIP